MVLAGEVMFREAQEFLERLQILFKMMQIDRSVIVQCPKLYYQRRDSDDEANAFRHGSVFANVYMEVGN